jgi:hypothetical protein
MFLGDVAAGNSCFGVPRQQEKSSPATSDCFGSTAVDFTVEREWLGWMENGSSLGVGSTARSRGYRPSSSDDHTTEGRVLAAPIRYSRTLHEGIKRFEVFLAW